MENKDGKVTKAYEPDVLNQIEGVSGNTWDAVQSGNAGSCYQQQYILLRWEILQCRNFRYGFVILHPDAVCLLAMRQVTIRKSLHAIPYPKMVYESLSVRDWSTVRYYCGDKPNELIWGEIHQQQFMELRGDHRYETESHH